MPLFSLRPLLLGSTLSLFSLSPAFAMKDADQQGTGHPSAAQASVPASSSEDSAVSSQKIAIPELGLTNVAPEIASEVRTLLETGKIPPAEVKKIQQEAGKMNLMLQTRNAEIEKLTEEMKRLTEGGRKEEATSLEAQKDQLYFEVNSEFNLSLLRLEGMIKPFFADDPALSQQINDLFTKQRRYQNMMQVPVPELKGETVPYEAAAKIKGLIQTGKLSAPILERINSTIQDVSNRIKPLQDRISQIGKELESHSPSSKEAASLQQEKEKLTKELSTLRVQFVPTLQGILPPDLLQDPEVQSVFSMLMADQEENPSSSAAAAVPAAAMTIPSFRTLYKQENPANTSILVKGFMTMLRGDRDNLMAILTQQESSGKPYAGELKTAIDAKVKLLNAYVQASVNYAAYHNTSFTGSGYIPNSVQRDKANKERDEGINKWFPKKGAAFQAAHDAGWPTAALDEAADARKAHLGIKNTNEGQFWKTPGLVKE